MTPDQTALAKRLRVHPKWRWVDGMAACPWGEVGQSERIYLAPTPQGLEPCWGGNEKRWYPLLPGAVPDLSDYATAAILLRMAMEAGADIDTNPGDAQRWGDRLGQYAAQALLAAWDE